MSVTMTRTVSGVTCSHRVAALSKEMTRALGVHGVRIDLTSRAVTVESESNRPIDEVRPAVDEAEYELADAGA